SATRAAPLPFPRWRPRRRTRSGAPARRSSAATTGWPSASRSGPGAPQLDGPPGVGAGEELRLAPALLALAVAVAVTVATAHGHARATAKAGRPNVVVIMTDDETVRDMEVMPRTRRLLGARGVTFRNSFVSYPLCCPSR